MNFLRTLIGACAGMRFYRLALDWNTGDALAYLTKFSALLSLLMVAILVPRGLRWTEQTREWITNDLQPPTFSIERGKIHSDVPQPFVRQLPGFLFVLDTTGTTPLAATGGVNGIIVTADRLFAWSQGNAQPMLLDVAPFPDGRVDGDYVALLMKTVVWCMALPGIGILLAMFFVSGLAQAAFFSSMARLVERCLPSGYGYGALFRIGVLALTPAMVMAVGNSAFGIGSDWMTLVYLGIYGFYFAGASAACRPAAPNRDETE